MVSTTRPISCLTERSRVAEPTCPRKYFETTMLVACCDQGFGISTWRCSKTTCPFHCRSPHRAAPIRPGRTGRYPARRKEAGKLESGPMASRRGHESRGASRRQVSVPSRSHRLLSGSGGRHLVSSAFVHASSARATPLPYGALALSETRSVSCLWSRACRSFEVQRSCRRRCLNLIACWGSLPSQAVSRATLNMRP